MPGRENHGAMLLSEIHIPLASRLPAYTYSLLGYPFFLFSFFSFQFRVFPYTGLDKETTPDAKERLAPDGRAHEYERDDPGPLEIQEGSESINRMAEKRRKR